MTKVIGLLGSLERATTRNYNYQKANPIHSGKQ